LIPRESSLPDTCSKTLLVELARKRVVRPGWWMQRVCPGTPVQSEQPPTYPPYNPHITPIYPPYTPICLLNIPHTTPIYPLYMPYTLVHFSPQPQCAKECAGPVPRRRGAAQHRPSAALLREVRRRGPRPVGPRQRLRLPGGGAGGGGVVLQLRVRHCWRAGRGLHSSSFQLNLSCF